MGAEECREVAVHHSEQLHDLGVFELVEAQPAILLGDLHAEGAHLCELGHPFSGVLSGRIDLHRVPLIGQEGPELLEELEELWPPLGALRVGVNEIEAEVSEEHLLHEAGVRPGCLPGLLSDAAGVFFGDVELVFSGHLYLSCPEVRCSATPITRSRLD